MTDLKEIEKRRAERREHHEKARDAQIAIDLEAIDGLEAERGEPLHTMTAPGFKHGAPVKAAFRAPTPTEYKRYCDMVGKAQQKSDAVERRKAQEMLAEACLVYPTAKTDAREAMLHAFPGVLLSLAIEVAKVAELQSEEEGKG
jgi:hypothetical protein